MKTEVIYRKEKTGQIIAVFPYIIHNGYLMTCFTDEGHSGCDYDYILSKTKPAKEDEYKYRNRLLFNFYGYDTKPIFRINNKKYIQAVKQAYTKNNSKL